MFAKETERSDVVVVSCRIIRGPVWVVELRRALIAALVVLGTLALLQGPVALLGILFPWVAPVLLRARLVIDPSGLTLRWLFLRRRFQREQTQVAINATSRVRTAEVRVLANGEDWALRVREADLGRVTAGLPEEAVKRVEGARLVPDTVALTVMTLAALCGLLAMWFSIGRG